MTDNSLNQGDRAGVGFHLVSGGYSLGMTAAAYLYSWWARRTGRWSQESAMERWGRSLPESCPGNPIWIHAASMGEARVAGQFAHELVKRQCSIIASSMTESGYCLSRDIYPTGTKCFRVPLDLRGPLHRTLAHFHPAALVLVETEWWPNMLRECFDAGLKVFVVNGRISAHALKRYRLGGWYWRRLLSQVELFYMRSEEDAERLAQLGIAPDSIKVTGSLKAMFPPNGVDSAAASGAMEVAGGDPLWIAGCTRPGEEEIVLDAFAGLRHEFPKLRLWLAPRHADRFDHVARLLSRRGLEFRRWTECQSPGRRTSISASIILIDQLGQLASLYRHATVAFIGGSLKPFGGHNPLEPALAGAPVIFGPHMDDQKDTAGLLLTLGMATQVSDTESLGNVVASVLRHPRTTAERTQAIDQIMARYAHTRFEVADDLCRRLGMAISGSRPVATPISMRG